MSPERIVQLALGVPDAIDASRRRESAAINLGLLGGLNREYIQEAGELAVPVYDALLETLAAGELDGAIAGWSDAKRAIRTVAQQARQTNVHPNTTNDLASVGVDTVVAWASEHPRLDDIA